MEPDDFALMDGVKNDREGAFEALVGRYQKRLYRLACGYLRNHEDALDAVQETLVKIYAARAGYRPDAHPFTWAARILANHCIDQIRQRRVRPAVSLEETEDRSTGRGSLVLVSSEESPHSRQERRELARALEEAIAALPATQRDVFMLRHFGEMRLEEIARSRGCALGTVKSSLHRATRALRDVLSRHGSAVALELGEGEST